MGERTRVLMVKIKIYEIKIILIYPQKNVSFSGHKTYNLSYGKRALF